MNFRPLTVEIPQKRREKESRKGKYFLYLAVTGKRFWRLVLGGWEGVVVGMVDCTESVFLQSIWSKVVDFSLGLWIVELLFL